MGDAVLVETAADGVRTLTFNRPERRNGWSSDLEDAYYAALTDATTPPPMRARPPLAFARPHLRAMSPAAKSRENATAIADHVDSESSPASVRESERPGPSTLAL